MELIPEAPADVRDDARFAFWQVQMLRDDARAVALARERVRNAQPAQIANLKPEFGGGLWESRVMFEPDFASLPFDEQKARFRAELPLAVSSREAIEPRPGQRDHAPYHAAGVPLLSWWKGQGNKVTANLGRVASAPGRRDPRPSAAVRFLANEFLDIARWYGNSEWAAESEDYENPEAFALLRLPRGKMEQIAFKVAAQHKKDHTAKR